MGYIYNPEQREDEVFVGNRPLSRDASHLSHLKTLRFGKTAYDHYGNKLELTWVPVFINRSEADAYDAIQMAIFRKIRRS